MKTSFREALDVDAEFPTLLSYCRFACEPGAYAMALLFIVGSTALGQGWFDAPWLGAAVGTVMSILLMISAWVGDRDDWEFMRPHLPTESF